MMNRTTKRKVLNGFAALLFPVALLLLVLSFILIREGGWPQEGGGSLGHVGMIIGGIIAAFLALISTLFAILCISKSRRMPS